MRVSQAYNLGRNQSTLDFLDIDLSTDIPVFLDASAIRSLESPWGSELTAILDNFFGLILTHIRDGNHDSAKQLLASLNESNEYHLGHSAGKPRGHAFGKDSAVTVWSALADNESKVADLLNVIEDSIMLVPGVGSDMISDAICNILRGPFIKFTQDACHYYGIPLSDEIASGPIWNVEKHQWEASLLKLPVHDIYGRFILVPKNIVRHKITCDAHGYYRHHLLPLMQNYEIKLNSSIVQSRKNNTFFVTKKDLMKKYGADKMAIIKQTEKHPNALTIYKSYIVKNPQPPLSHNEVSTLVKEDKTDWNTFIKKLRELPSGKNHSGDYENLIEQIFTALLYPSLCYPRKQFEIHDGRKRIDITYCNEASEGFFYWIKEQVPSLFVVVECKNYENEIGNPEVDQIAGRFSKSRGQVGILVYRIIKDRDKLNQRCKDTVNDSRGWIMNLNDDDVIALIEEKKREENAQDMEDSEVTKDDMKKSKFSRLRNIFTQLIS